MLKLLRVTGRSLAPEYQEGDFVLTAKIPFLLKYLKQGDIVVFKHPVYGTMIKRVASILPDSQEVFVLGTQEDSVDSRRFGSVRVENLLGKVIWHIRKPSNH